MIAPQPTIAADGTGLTPRAFPPADPGLPALSVEALLDAHAELIKRIKVCFGVDRNTFEREVMTLVSRYTAFVHLLPATPDNYFSDPGGLLQLGLETAFFALQGTDAHIFSGRATITVRRHLEPRWRLATFIGGLCSEIHRSMSRVCVMDPSGDEWPAYLTALLPWLQTRNASRYFLKWRAAAPPIPGFALYALPQIVPAPMLHHLAQGNSTVVPHLMACLSETPLPQDHNTLDGLVRRSAAVVIDRYLRERAEHIGQPHLGAHLHRYLLDGMRRLVASDPAWQPNADRSRVWLGSDGLFVVWPGAAADLRKLLEADRLPGAPKSAETMQDILMAAGLLQAAANGQGLWTIHPPGSKASMEAVKVSAPGLVLTGLHPRPSALPHTLCRPVMETFAQDPAHRSVTFKAPRMAGEAGIVLCTGPAPGAPRPHVVSAPIGANDLNELGGTSAECTANSLSGPSGPSGTSAGIGLNWQAGQTEQIWQTVSRGQSSEATVTSTVTSPSAPEEHRGARGATPGDAAGSNWTHMAPSPAEQLELSELWGAAHEPVPDIHSRTMAADNMHRSPHHSPGAPPPTASASSSAETPSASTSPPSVVLQAQSNPAARPAGRAALSLNAPMRLAPVVRRAIDGVINALNDATPAVAACVTPTGLFITFEALEERGIPVPIAVRALSDAGMLAKDTDTDTDTPSTTQALHGALSLPGGLGMPGGLGALGTAQPGALQVVHLDGQERRGVVIARSCIKGAADWPASTREPAMPQEIVRVDRAIAVREADMSDASIRPQVTDAPISVVPTEEAGSPGRSAPTLQGEPRDPSGTSDMTGADGSAAPRV